MSYINIIPTKKLDDFIIQADRKKPVNIVVGSKVRISLKRFLIGLTAPVYEVHVIIEQDGKRVVLWKDSFGFCDPINQYALWCMINNFDFEAIKKGLEVAETLKAHGFKKILWNGKRFDEKKIKSKITEFKKKMMKLFLK